MKKLSAYTIATNCTDIVDVCDGILEIRIEAKKRRDENKKTPSYYYVRLRKLAEKLVKLINKAIEISEHEFNKLELLDSMTPMTRAKYSELAIRKLNRKLDLARI